MHHTTEFKVPRFSNAIAENNNLHIQKVIDVSYGVNNFKRLEQELC